MSRRLLDRARRYFISGLFAVIPLGLSLLVAAWFVRAVDDALAPIVWAALGRTVPGLGVLAAVALTFLAGVVASHVLGGRLIALVEEFLMRVPGFRWVYGPAKQMTEAFSPEKARSFRSVVLVEYPRPGCFSVGFATGETELDGEGLTAVYVPTNHVYIGDVVLVPRAKVVRTSMTVQQGIQALLAAGAGLPARLERRGA